MTKERFSQVIKQIINIYQENEDYFNKLLDLKIDLLDTPLYECSGKFLDLLVEVLILNEDKIDTFYWYIFEYLPKMKEENKLPCQMNAMKFDANGNPICYDVESLIDYLYES